MADEYKWSDFKKRAVLESKLEGHSKSKYWEGLGNDDTLDFQSRIQEFLRLFSRKVKPDEGQDLFLKCIQGKDESVISYKLRLVGLSETLRERLKGNKEIYEDFLVNQFKRGLKPELRLEVLKKGDTKLCDVINFAIEIEECLKLCNGKGSVVNAVISQEDQITKLKKQVEDLGNQVKQFKKNNNSKRDMINHIICKSCGWKGHSEQQCRNKNIFSPQTNHCNYCYKRGHSEQICYYNPDNATSNKARGAPSNQVGNFKQKKKFKKGDLFQWKTAKHKIKGKSKYANNDVDSDYDANSENMYNSLLSLDIENETESTTASQYSSEDEPTHYKQRSEKILSQKHCKSSIKKVNKFFDDLAKSKGTDRPQTVVSYSNLYKNKPIIKIKLFDREINALFDSGAEITVIKPGYLLNSDCTVGHQPTAIHSPITGDSITGYYTRVKLTIGEIEFNQTACIADIDGGGEFQMIMGFNMMIRHQSINDVARKHIRFAIDTSETWEEELSCSNIGTIGSFFGGKDNSNSYEEILKLVKINEINIQTKHKDQFKHILNKYQGILIEDVTKMGGANLEPYEPSFKSDNPIYQRQYRIPHSMFNPLRAKLDKFETAGIISKAASAWNSPVLAVKKDGGNDVRMVLDLRKLNSIIDPLPYPLMRIEDIINRLGGSKVFSNLDLNNGYYNVKLADSVKDRFCFTTPWGRYRMERLPQGLITAASVFQMIMNNALHDLIGRGHVFVFQDDIIVHTATEEEHLVVLGELFEALSKINMATKPSKCSFFKDSVRFLGHIVDRHGSRPSNENIQAILNFPRPNSVKRVRSFIGTINFYRKFIHNVTELAAPLYALIKKDHTKINWSQECEQAFLALKDALVKAPVLSYPDFTQDFMIKCDASNVGIGAVLEQEIDGEVHPIAFCSRKLNKAERNYSVIEREALAIVYALSQFRPIIYGYRITLKTDHKPLSFIFQLKDNNQRLIRWLLHIQDYQLQIEYLPGKFNFVADMLSRGDECAQVLNMCAIRETEEAISNTKIKDAQMKDEKCITLIDKVKNGNFTDNEYVLDESQVLLKQVFPSRSRGWKFRIVVPDSLRNNIMYHYHDSVYSGHYSITKTIWKIKQLFTWDTMFRDIDNYIKTCTKCQKRNIIHTKAPFQPVSPPSYPMERLSIDLLGPFNRSKLHNKYLIVYTDGLTRMIFASPLPNMEAQTVAQNFIQNIFSLHGGCRQIVTDRGPQFTGTIFRSLCKELGIKHTTTTSYHANANGIAERANSKILNTLAHICNNNFDNWDMVLPHCIHALNTSPHRSTGESPFFLFHAFDPVDFMVEASSTSRDRFSNIPDFVEQISHNIEKARHEVEKKLLISSRVNCEARNSGRKLNEFQIGQQVLYLDSTSYTGKNRKMKSRYLGPYRIVERTGLVNYRIRNVHKPNDIKSVHVDKLKRFYPREVIDDADTGDAIILPGDSLDEPSSSWTEDEVDEDLLFIHMHNSELAASNNETGKVLSQPVDIHSGNNSEDDQDLYDEVLENIDIPDEVMSGNDLVVDDQLISPSPATSSDIPRDIVGHNYNLRKNIKMPIRYVQDLGSLNESIMPE